MARPRPSTIKRQREQAKRDRRQRKVERREDRKQRETEGSAATATPENPPPRS